MIDREFWRRLARETQNLFPLLRYLILQTETHAFCLALSAAALLGFFPACLVMLAVFKNILGSAPYQEVILTPTGHDFYSVSRDSDGALTMRVSEEPTVYGT